MKRQLSNWLERTWYAPSRPPLWLRGLEGFYRLAASRLVRPADRPPVPVIVVGNLTAGGSGKTPVVEALVLRCRREGLEPAIISRGFGGAEPARPVRVDAGAGARLAGDEALLLSRTTGAPVWICRRRRLALEAAVAAGANVVISDDGLQHRGLPRSLEICVIDGRRRFGNGRLLPAGPLRQAPMRLESVDFRLVKNPPGEVFQRQGELGFELEPVRLVPIGGGDGTDPAALAPGPVDAVAGLADPESFFITLERLGYRVRRHPRPDHHRFRAGELARLDGPVLVTAKDAVKLDPNERNDVYVLEVTAALPEALVRAVLEHVREFARDA